MLHEIRFDAQGCLTLTEFLRLAGLYAVDAADGDDLAAEFTSNEMTLTLTPEEFADTTAYDWYLASFRAYDLAREGRPVLVRVPALDAQREQERVNAVHAAYLALLDDAAEYLLDLAGRADAPVTEIAPVLPLRPRA